MYRCIFFVHVTCPSSTSIFHIHLPTTNDIYTFTHLRPRPTSIFSLHVILRVLVVDDDDDAIDDGDDDDDDAGDADDIDDDDDDASLGWSPARL